LANLERAEREGALAAFYKRWKSDPLVLDKWFSVQATSSLPRTLERVRALTEHEDFTLKNPNRVRSLVGAFCMGNQVRFHAANGAGYELLGDTVLELDSINPQVSARIVSSLNSWKRFDAGRRTLMQAQLERIAAKDGLSKDVFEIVTKALGN
jgi:aminopeptidase N